MDDSEEDEKEKEEKQNLTMTRRLAISQADKEDKRTA